MYPQRHKKCRDFLAQDEIPAIDYEQQKYSDTNRTQLDTNLKTVILVFFFGGSRCV